jgi:hypothetical protein
MNTSSVDLFMDSSSVDIYNRDPTTLEPAVESIDVDRYDSPPPSQMIDVDLLPTPPAPTKQHEVIDDDMSGISGLREPLTIRDFIPNFIPKFNGYACHFLRKSAYQLLRCFSTAVAITSNDSLAIFNLPGIQRRRLASRCDQVMELARVDDAQTRRNPFLPNGTDGTIFLRLSATVRFFRQMPDFSIVPMQRNELQHGRSYPARIAMLLKGAKVSATGQLSPMLAIGQVLIVCPRGQEPVLDQDQCVLDDPVTDEDDDDEENVDPERSVVNELI